MDVAQATPPTTVDTRSGATCCVADDNVYASTTARVHRITPSPSPPGTIRLIGGRLP